MAPTAWQKKRKLGITMSTQTKILTEQDERIYTVEMSPKIDLMNEKRLSTTPTWLSVLKWLFTIIMFCSSVVCLSASKICFIAIAKKLNDGRQRNNNNNDNASDWTITKMINSSNKVSSTSSTPTVTIGSYSGDVAFTMILLFMLIPHVFSLLRAFVDSYSGIWPSKKTIAWGVLASVLECAGLTLFSVIIARMSNMTHAIFVMNSIFILPLAYQVFREIKKVVCRSMSHSDKKGRYHMVARFAVCAILSLGGFGMFGFHMAAEPETHVEHFMIIVFMLCLSSAWCPKMLKLQMYTETFSAINGDMKRTCTMKEEKTSRNRMTMITSALKFFLTILFAFGLNFWFKIADNGDPGKSLHNGFAHFNDDVTMLYEFYLQVFCSLLGYAMCLLACTINLQKICFVCPLFLATPISILFVCVEEAWTGSEWVGWEPWQIGAMAALGTIMWLAQVSSLNVEMFKSQEFLMAREELLFWLPVYNALLLEQHLLLNRKNEIVDVNFINYREVVKNSHIYICTTMYREADYEMEQLLKSIGKIDAAQAPKNGECRRYFESHIWFDDGARAKEVKRHALQLISLLKKTTGAEPEDVIKIETPYGLQLKWKLKHGMPFFLHLKDKIKVKNKKRWSQVMYMSYILDFKEPIEKDDCTYILATDADVKFTPDDVMALMDLMSRSPKVAAVCGRTQPMGIGPLVWYQVFDYAIGHWLLKVANHVFGSVLCSPGCFSVYRAKAVRDVLPLYASGTVTAMDFLMKDMGEDRWFCTLLVEAGWRLEYCAASKDSTYCPMEFDEFYKQRRRWGPSTLANSLIVLGKQSEIRRNNDSINLLFIVYQFLLIASSIIGPATVLLIMAGGMNYCYGFNLVVLLVVEIVITVGYTLVCLYCTQDTQLNVAKWLTFFFTIVMVIVTVGLITQTVDQVELVKKLVNESTSINRKIDAEVVVVELGPAPLYLMCMVTLYICTALLHPSEFTNLVHGIWYFLCLPSGSLLLTIYSVANLTDKSWGTREEKTQSILPTNNEGWRDSLRKYLLHICRCCIPPSVREGYVRLNQVERDADDEDGDDGDKEDENDSSGDESDTYEPDVAKEVITNEEEHDSTEQCIYENIWVDNEKPSDNFDGHSRLTGLPLHMAAERSSAPPSPLPSPKLCHKLALQPPQVPLEKTTAPPSPESSLKLCPKHAAQHQSKLKRAVSKKLKGTSYSAPQQVHDARAVSKVTFDVRVSGVKSVENWLKELPPQYKAYASNFRMHGYDDVSFIAGYVKEKDLKDDMGIENRGHRKRLIAAIETLPVEELFEEIPDNVEDWLMKYGLDMYYPKFQENSVTEPRDLADIKGMSKKDITDNYGIEKKAHLQKLMAAIKKLQYPSKAQRLIREARKAVTKRETLHMKTENYSLSDNGELGKHDESQEFIFWSHLRLKCLLPEESAFNQSKELQDKLESLRNTALLVYCAANVLWLAIIITVMGQDSLNLMGSSPLSLIFLALYTVVLIFQFVALICHRFWTLIHLVARAPFTPGNLKANWSWNDADLPKAPDNQVLEEVIHREQKQLQRSISNYSNRTQNSHNHGDTVDGIDNEGFDAITSSHV